MGPEDSGVTTRQHKRADAIQASGVALVTFLFILRLVNALSIKTFFQPDEFYQSLEPAWNSAFGESSNAWITWASHLSQILSFRLMKNQEWREHLRSSIHPLLFAGVYKAAAQFSRFIHAGPVLHSQILLLAPKVLQAGFATTTDLFTYRLACKLFGPQHSASLAALALTVVSPWQWFCSARTLSNSLETTLTIVALDLWPWNWFLEADESPAAKTDRNVPQSNADLDAKQMVDQFRKFLDQDGTTTQTKAKAEKNDKARDTGSAPKVLHLSLSFAAMACILRPTNIIIWGTVGVALLLYYHSIGKTTTLATTAIVSGSMVLVTSISMDRSLYGDWVFPPVRFLYFNVVQSLSVFYGKNRHDYYLTEGLPLLLTTALPFAVIGLWTSLRPEVDRPSFRGYIERQTRYVLALAVVTSVVALSLISHKEMRFIYPLLPILHVLAARPLASFFSPFPLPTKKVRLALMIFGLTLNIYIAAYTAYVHQRGAIDVMHYLRHEYENRLLMPIARTEGAVGTRNLTVGFFMPCHSTPWRSHFVYPEINAWALTCEPPLNLTMAERESYLDEADVFYSHPASWIHQNMKDRKIVRRNAELGEAAREGDEARKEWPQYLVFFQHLEPTMNAVLQGSRYEECWRSFNTHWHDDWRRQGDVVVWCIRE